MDKLKDYLTLPAPTDSIDFFEKIKELSNLYWGDTDMNPGIYGFQIQKDTRWRNGLTDEEISAFEKAMGFNFPPPLRHFYKTMNGLDKKGINVFGNSGQAFTYKPIYYSFPDDLDLMKDSIAWIYEATHTDIDQLLQNGISRIFPVCGHRFMLVDDPQHRILSMYGSDIVPWADNISKLIATDIFENIYNAWEFESHPDHFDIPFWLD